MNKRGLGRPRKVGRPKGSKNKTTPVKGFVATAESLVENDKLFSALLTSDDTAQKLYETALAIVAYKDTPIYRGHMSDFRGTAMKAHTKLLDSVTFAYKILKATSTEDVCDQSQNQN